MIEDARHETLLDRFLPERQFSERHAISIAAPPERVLDAVAELSLGDDPVCAALLGLRVMPARILGALGVVRVAAERERGFSMAAFTPLGRLPGREIAWGLVGRFWRADGGLEPIADAATFAAPVGPGRAKLVWSFQTEPNVGGTRLVTLTGVRCPDRDSRRRFAAYWLLLRPFSGLIRRRVLATIKSKAEHGLRPPAGAASCSAETVPVPVPGGGGPAKA